MLRFSSLFKVGPARHSCVSTDQALPGKSSDLDASARGGHRAFAKGVGARADPGSVGRAAWMGGSGKALCFRPATEKAWFSLGLLCGIVGLLCGVGACGLVNEPSVSAGSIGTPERPGDGGRGVRPGLEDNWQASDPSDPTDPDPTDPGGPQVCNAAEENDCPEISPVFECQTRMEGRVFALFGYHNTSGQRVAVPASAPELSELVGGFIPCTQEASLPTLFLPGRRQEIFAAVIGAEPDEDPNDQAEEGNVVWKLRGRTATGSAAGSECNPNRIALVRAMAQCFLSQ